MRRVLLALLAELIPAAMFIVVGCGILLDCAFFVEGPAMLLEGLGLSQQAAGWVMIASAAVSIAVTLWRLIPHVRQMHLGRVLAENGVRVSGVVVDMHNSRVFRVNNTYPVRLTVRCTAPSGRETEVRSAIIWSPETKVGDAADVLFDPVDEERCFVRLREKYVKPGLNEQKKGLFR